MAKQTVRGMVEKLKADVRSGVVAGDKQRAEAPSSARPTKAALAAAKKELAGIRGEIAEARREGETRVTIMELECHEGSDGFSDNDWPQEVVDAVCYLLQKAGYRIRVELPKSRGFSANLQIEIPS